jgi:hypothetical protein
MSLTNLISSNLNFAISQIQTSLTSIPSNGETYIANKQDAESSFDIYEDGREEMIDTKFYINRNDYSALPYKGMILSDGTKNYKVINAHDDALNITRRIDCQAQYQR